MKDEKYRYRKGERVVITGLRHQPQAEVTVDQPRSSTRVHVRELEGDRINRHLHADNLTLWEEWVKRQPTPTEQPNEIVTRFRAALEEYLQSHTVPPKGKGHNKGVDAAYDYALAQAEARRYYDLGRGYTGRFLKAKRERKVGLNTPDPVASADEQLGVSLSRSGAQLLKEHYRKQVRKHYQETGEAWTPVPVEAVVTEGQDKPKLEIHVNIPAEVFDPKTELARKAMIVQWVELTARDSASAFLPDFPLIHHFIGVTKETYDEATATLQRNGYVFAGMGLGWWVLPPKTAETTLAMLVDKMSNKELWEAMSLITEVAGRRMTLPKENPG